jgi:hypothetical protein
LWQLGFITYELQKGVQNKVAEFAFKMGFKWHRQHKMACFEKSIFMPFLFEDGIQILSEG